MKQNLLLALGAISNAMQWFSKEHPQYLELELAKQCLLDELKNENSAN